jgi:hypothetical protein
VALSVVGTDRMLASGYFRAKMTFPSPASKPKSQKSA